MDEINEIVQTIELLQDELDDLLVRGLRAVDAATLARLRAASDEFRRIAAEHIAGRMDELIKTIENDNPGAARALLQAQTSLRLFERVLTLDVAGAKLQGLVEATDACEQEATA